METLTLLVLLISIICLTIPLGMAKHDSLRQSANDYHTVPIRPRASAFER